MTIRNSFWQIVRPATDALRKARQKPKVGSLSWGDFSTTTPINNNWGFERGTPIDRYYIAAFLEANAGHIQGRVLEVAGNEYTKQYGGDRVSASDVLHPSEGNPRATVIADLAEPSQITDNLFDCVICTQTLQLIFDIHTATESLYRFLKPGGVLLLTVPCVSQICREDMAITGDYWRFTTAALQRLLETQFPSDAVHIESHGNVKTSVGFLHGVSADEIAEEELLESDPHCQMLLTGVATRPK